MSYLRFRTMLIAGFFPVVLSVNAAHGEEGKVKKVRAGDLQLSVPMTWKQEKPASRFRIAQFSIPPADGDQQNAELVLFYFRGGGGGVDANLQRWIGQFQPKGRKVQTWSGSSAQGEYYLADVKGTYNKPIGPPIAGKTHPTAGQRMLAVILIAPNKKTYFLKMTGPETTISSSEQSLRKSFGAAVKKEKKYPLKK